MCCAWLQQRYSRCCGHRSRFWLLGRVDPARRSDWWKNSSRCGRSSVSDYSQRGLPCTVRRSKFSYVLKGNWQLESLLSGGTLCITETLTAVEAITGPLTLGTIFSVLQTPPSQIPASVVCTDCNQETYNLLAKIITSSSFTSFFQTECGASFVSKYSIFVYTISSHRWILGGTSPSDITETANTAVVSGSWTVANCGTFFSFWLLFLSLYLFGICNEDFTS